MLTLVLRYPKFISSKYSYILYVNMYEPAFSPEMEMPFLTYICIDCAISQPGPLVQIGHASG